MNNLYRWDPFQDAMSLREAMNRLFEDSFVRSLPSEGGQGLVPALDLSESADAFQVEMAVPGMKAEDLEIMVENNILTISGEIKQGEETKDRNYHRLERRFGRFQRSLSLPSTVKPDAISAQLEHGILHLEIPKAEEVKPRRISVSVQ